MDKLLSLPQSLFLLIQEIPIFLLFISGFAFVSCQEKSLQNLPFYHTPDFTATWQSDTVKNQHYITDYHFINQDGENYGTEDLRGKIHVMNCFFTVCPGLCPTLMGNLKTVENAFKNDEEVMLISLSVTPERDSYAKSNQIYAKKWQLLTGNKTAIYQTARRSYFVDENLGTELGENDFLHTENVILVDKNLQIRGIYTGSLPLEIEHLIEDIKILKREEL